MSAGTWKLTLAAVEPGNSATFTVEWLGHISGDEPKVRTDEATFTAVYADGTVSIWPWANLLSAHFTPAERSGEAASTADKDAPGVPDARSGGDE